MAAALETLHPLRVTASTGCTSSSSANKYTRPTASTKAAQNRRKGFLRSV
eukprot:CAMPEP_0204435588 /NCGR_PEP_ID=MMETSP0470-20130426/73880_1 /ASSEMBLY_ACC=CAM_ASM_000385 /TAXON_ID=2969 /ORGANISM="Oxyrrhis marina" /LENGTH=49 /DNA_ID=CAMNT_0051434171 /DNA_START=128 /DNA_END=277 /DNA_ORIENTATION=+